MALLFIMVTAFLGAMGMGLITPVAPYFIAPYVNDPAAIGITLGWLTSIYAICQFLAAPGLGVLSDRFGRRPILLICVAGSAVGYLLLGVGGALWVLFLGRIIDGLTGANFSVAFAYIADVTEPDQRAKYFGLTGAISGIGMILGPTIGGLLARFGYTAPLYAAAAITVANLIFGLIFMPESLTPGERTGTVTLAKLNPFGILIKVFTMPQIRWLVLAIFLYSLPFAALQSNIGLFAKDDLNWTPEGIASVFVMVGLTDIVVQGLILRWLLEKLGESRVAFLGIAGEAVGYLLMASVAFSHMAIPMYAGVLIFAGSDGLLGPSVSSLLARRASRRDQGKLQGGSQSVQAMARICGPILGGVLYDQIGHSAPYLAGAIILIITLVVIGVAAPAAQRTSEADASAV